MREGGVEEREREIKKERLISHLYSLLCFVCPYPSRPSTGLNPVTHTELISGFIAVGSGHCDRNTYRTDVRPFKPSVLCLK